MAGVAAIVPYKIYPYNSGGQKSIALFYQFFSQRENVFLICTSNNSKPSDATYKTVPLLGNSVFRYINPFLYFSVKKLLISNHINVVIIEHSYFGWLGYLLKKNLKVKIIIHSHNIEGLRFKSLSKWWWKILLRYEKLTFSMADLSFFIQKNDEEYAVKNFHLNPRRTAVITYGITWQKPPDAKEKEDAKKSFSKLHNLSGSETVILFNGAYDYKPNRDALDVILNSINEHLLASIDFTYKIIICGRHIPAEILNQTFPNVILAGYVEDIEIYYKGADIFINPVNDGGGIKTKLVEALAYNITSVSTTNGAIGIDTKICNGKLLIADDYRDFTEKIIQACTIQTTVGDPFFNHFYWGNIVDKAIGIIEKHA